MTTSPVPTVSLRAGAASVDMPQLGFGVFQVPQDETEAVVRAALEAGYRSIDTAAAYGNEEGVGRALAASDLTQQEVFLTTKLWNSDQGYDEALQAYETSVRKLGREVDLYLIHWPTPAKDRYVDSFRALLKLREDGRLRVPGVSNFTPEHLQRVNDELGEFPAINQVELHPYFQQAQLREFHRAHDIHTEAWSPLGGQGGEVLQDPVIAQIAEKVGRTPAQVVLRWHLQLGNVVIPKSATPERIAQNFDVTAFSLDGEDLAAIAGLDRGTRVGPDPDEFNG
ncbi:aldo/keto reductase [Luteipulveratus sp. YIM 133132]|uniref:aldo/keto reductase n=1 Tax=Luteipulveratus flavus TaxID=3031728 RepID=UPI0023B04E9A|nr:aldo/keto reductase [Luteipulveratus sp. YIM 133132]MDE9367041.1 aldo/keto reductase [Luteipulveratus sp. YIM 133132]